LPLVALFAAGGLIVFGYSCATRTQTAGIESGGVSPGAARAEHAVHSDANAQQGAAVERISAASASAPATQAAPENVA